MFQEYLETETKQRELDRASNAGASVSPARRLLDHTLYLDRGPLVSQFSPQDLLGKSLTGDGASTGLVKPQQRATRMALQLLKHI